MFAVELQNANKRIDKLERKLRRQTRAMIALVILAVGASILIGQSPEMRIVEAEQFVLRGTHGEIIASLGPSGNGSGASLKLYDVQGRTRVALASDSNLSALGLFDAAGKEHANLFSSDEEGPAIVLTGKNLKSSATIDVTDDQQPYIQIRDDRGFPRAALGMQKDGSPAIAVFGASPENKAIMAMLGGLPSVVVTGPQLGSVTMSVGVENKRARRGGRVYIQNSGEESILKIGGN